MLAEPFFLGGTEVMRNVKDCVNAFLPLLNTEYEIILGRKGVAVTLKLAFDKKDCFHLMGLQYLIVRPELNRDREKVFDGIVAGGITTEQIESSDFYKKIEERVNFLPLLEQLLDSNDYTKNQAFWTMLYKKKCNLSTGEEVILYNRLLRE